MSLSRLLGIVSLSALAAAPLVQAQPVPRGHHGMMQGPGPRMVWGVDESCMLDGPCIHGDPRRMNLTSAQRKRADEIFDHARTRSRALQAQMLNAQTRLREALGKPARDRNEIMQAWREVEALRTRHFENNLDAQLAFDRLLEPAKGD